MADPLFSQSTHEWHPYGNFRFLVKWDNKYVAGFSRVSISHRAESVANFRPGEDPALARVVPGQSEYAAITLESGVTHDRDFEGWANKVWDYRNSASDRATAQGLDHDFRRDLVIEMMNEAGQRVLAYNISRCWVSEFRALPELDAQGNAVAIQSLKLENEGWARDHSVVEPTDPSPIPPSA